MLVSLPKLDERKRAVQYPDDTICICAGGDFNQGGCDDGGHHGLVSVLVLSEDLRGAIGSDQ